jgi:DNA-binding response OmpR family regulator
MSVPRLLLIEDDVMLGVRVSLGLRQEGFSVDWVQDRAAAESALQSGRYSALVVDIAFPRRNALSILDWLSDHAKPLPVVVMTARAGEERSALDLNGLVARIRAALRRNPAERRNAIALPFSWS